ncbi:hypothetical protein PGB90_009651 [Kerria lacca]
MSIKNTVTCQNLDSRGTSTIEVDLWTNFISGNHFTAAVVFSGFSTGVHEALEFSQSNLESKIIKVYITSTEVEYDNNMALRCAQSFTEAMKMGAKVYYNLDGLYDLDFKNSKSYKSIYFTVNKLLQLYCSFMKEYSYRINWGSFNSLGRRAVFAIENQSDRRRNVFD